MDKLPFECKRVGENDRQPPVARNFWTLQSHIKSKKSLFLRRKVSMEFEVKLNKKHRIQIHVKKLTRVNSAGKKCNFGRVFILSVKQILAKASHYLRSEIMSP